MDKIYVENLSRKYKKTTYKKKSNEENKKV